MNEPSAPSRRDQVAVGQPDSQPGRDGSSTRKRRTLRDRHKEFTGNQLLSSALEQFITKGYALTTIDDIAEHAGTSRATFYLHFKNKEDIVEELVKPIRQSSRVELAEFCSALMSSGDVDVRSWVEGQLAYRSQHRDVLRIWNEAAAVTQSLQSPAALHAQVIAEALIGHRSRSKREARQARRLQLLFISMWAGHERLMQAWEASAIPMSADELVDHLTDLWEHMFREQVKRIMRESD
jgi:AcrR family transcriptional regulator